MTASALQSFLSSHQRASAGIRQISVEKKIASGFVPQPEAFWKQPLYL
jgi:hypothetical protein